MGEVRKYVGIAVVAGVIGGLGIVTLVNHYAYIATRTELSRELAKERLERRNLFQRSSLWYGTIESIDTAHGTLSVRFINQFVAAREEVSLVIKVTSETLIARQELIRSGNEYVGFAEKVEGSLSDIHPGTRVAAVLENNTEAQEVLARIILFGNPL